MTEETSTKQTGAMSMKRQKVEDEEDDMEEYEGRITRKMAEPEWMKRIDRIGKNVGTFTERVENFEQRMKDKERIERKWREKTTEALTWQKAKLNSLWRVLKDMTDVIDEIDAVVAQQEGAGGGGTDGECDGESRGGGGGSGHQENHFGPEDFPG
jgi:DNA repair ATPase RecN